MSSGVRFTSNYGGGDDLAVLARLTILQEGTGGVATVAPFLERDRAPGVRYVYKGADTQVLGLVLREATGRNLSEYLSEKIWPPMGAESHGSWLIDKGGYATAFAFFQATLRDWGRLGMLLANDGVLDGSEIIPAAWVREATTAQADYLKPGRAEANFGYGYQVRILPQGNRQFLVLGLRGQMVFVDTQTTLVMVHTGAFDVKDSPGAVLSATSLWQGVLRSLSN